MRRRRRVIAGALFFVFRIPKSSQALIKVVVELFLTTFKVMAFRSYCKKSCWTNCLVK